MANVRIDLSYPIVDGQPLTFRAPCDCTSVTGIKVYYPNGETTESKEFTFKDAHRNDLAEIGDLFASGAYVKVIVDTTNNVAYIQNADTNKYLEDRFEKLKSFTTNCSVGTLWEESDGYYMQEIYCPSVSSSDTPIIDILTGSDNDANVEYQKAFSKVVRIETADGLFGGGKLIVWATEAIPTAFPIQIKVVR